VGVFSEHNVVLSSWQGHCESSFGSYNECSRCIDVSPYPPAQLLTCNFITRLLYNKKPSCR